MIIIILDEKVDYGYFEADRGCCNVYAVELIFRLCFLFFLFLANMHGQARKQAEVSQEVKDGAILVAYTVCISINAFLNVFRFFFNLLR